MTGTIVRALSPFALAALVVACGGETPAPATAATATAAQVTGSVDAKLRASLAGAQRTDAEKKRDVYRHPLETLTFFGLKDDMTVVELSPGGGWYTAVLAPVLRERGKLIVAGGDPNGDPNSEGTKDAKALLDRFSKAPSAFDKVQPLAHQRGTDWNFGAPESVDMFVTFRNFHNFAPDAAATDKVLKSIYAVLKHGGVLGLTDHRASAGTAFDPKVVDKTGYITQDQVIKMVEAAGFKLADKSEVNANPKDVKDYPEGVWTLPPTYALGDKDHAKYEAIGESDRMTLKFVKP